MMDEFNWRDYSFDDYVNALPSVFYRTIRPNSGWTYRTGGQSIITNCPCHDDRNPSFCMSEGKNRIIFHCFTGCTQKDLTNYFRKNLP
jgi:hypothetical protein